MSLFDCLFICLKGSQSAFRPINQGYIHHGGSGSSDSCLKPDMGSSDTDNSRPNTDILMDHEIASPGSDSGSYTAGMYKFI